MSATTIALSAGLLAMVAAVSCKAEPTTTCVQHGQAALASLTRGDYAHAGKDFAPGIAAQVTPEKLKEVWTQLQALAGTFRRLGDLQPRRVADHALLAATMDFSGGAMVALVDCDAQDRITTFRIVPASALPAAPKPATGIAHPVQVPTPLGPLPGTLELPRGVGPFPAVVLVAGSGPLDRDETFGPNKPFQDIADGLAAKGIASLRYDKRTLVYRKVLAGKSIVVDDEVTDDALTALRLLAKQPGVDPHRVFVLGHSLGALMAPRIGRRDPSLAGLILMAAPASFDLNVVLRQMRYLGPQQGMSAADLEAKLVPVIKARDELAHADPAHPPHMELLGAPAGYWLSVSAVHPIATAKTLHQPMLVLQGGGDYQVSPQLDFARWQAAFAHVPRVKLIEYPGLSHMFMPAGDPPSASDYMRPGHVDARVIGDIAAWIKAQSPAS